jgi:hypothetical protein
MAMSESRTLSVSIGCPLRKAYEFLAAPENFPQWTTGLCKSIKKTGDEWLAETPQGAMQVCFTERNDFGVVDHFIYPAPDVEIYVPIRVIANGTGSEVIFTLFRLSDVSDDKFAEVAAWVAGSQSVERAAGGLREPGCASPVIHPGRATARRADRLVREEYFQEMKQS